MRACKFNLGIMSMSISRAFWSDVQPQIIATGEAGQPIGTTVSFTVPTESQVGDVIIVGLMRRSAVTAPAGFTLVSEQVSPEGSLQWTCLYKAVVGQGVNAGDSRVFTQATSARMGLAWMVFRGVTATSALASVTGTSIPTTTAIKKAVYVSCMSSYYAGSGLVNTITPPSGHTLITPANFTNGRFALSFKTVVSGDDVSGSYSQAAPGWGPNASLAIAAVVVQ